MLNGPISSKYFELGVMEQVEDIAEWPSGFPGVPAAADAKATPPGAEMDVGNAAALAEPPVGFQILGDCQPVQFFINSPGNGLILLAGKRLSSALALTPVPRKFGLLSWVTTAAWNGGDS